MYRLITARSQYYAPAANIVMAVTIKGSPTEEALRTAIQKAVGKHEIFSNKVILDKNGDSFYLAIPPRTIELEIREIKENEDWKQLIKEQERTPFDFQKGEMIRFFLLKTEEIMKLIIVANHLAGDGLAIIYLIRDIMTALEQPDIEYDMLPVQLADDFGFPRDSALKPMIRFALKQINKSWNRNKRIFQYDEYLTMFHSYWKDRNLEILDETISGSELQRLVTRCRENHITVNSAIAAAFLLASKSENEVGLAVSIRPKGYEGMGNYASGISIQYDPKYRKSFWKNARDVHKLIYQRLKKNKEKYFVLQFLKEMEPTLIDASYFSTFTGYKNKSAAKVREWFGYNDKQQITIGISNLAKPKIPSKYGKYAIDNIIFVPPLQPYNKSVIGVVTTGEKMAITMQYEKKKGFENRRRTFEDALKILKYETA